MVNHKKMFVSAAAGALLLGTAAFQFSAGATPAVQATAANTGFLRKGTALNMVGGYSPTQAQAVALAQQVDEIVAVPRQFGAYVGAMKAVNPGLQIFAYVNGAFAQSSQAHQYPESWFLHSRSGGRVKSANFGNYMMDTTNPSWVANRGEACRAQVALSHYDGCMLDMLGAAPLDGGYLNALPLNPHTHQTLTSESLITANAALATSVGNAVAPHLVIANGLSSGVRYFGGGVNSSRLVQHIEGGMFEAWMRVPTMPLHVFPTEVNWKLNVDAVHDAETSGHQVIAMTKTWGSGTPAQQTQWHKFSLASFLLGSDGRSAFSFVATKAVDSIIGESSWDQLAIGTPTQTYAKVNGVYQRNFTNGLVLVNPTSSSVTVHLDHPQRTLEGNTVTSVTMTPDSGEVLVG